MSAIVATADVERRTRRHGLASLWMNGTIGLGLFVLWALGHAYVGIDGDAKIYMGRALADLDPTGVGRDLMFTNDGQSSFSLFRSLARTLVEAVGLGSTVAILTIVNLVVWFAAALTFVRGFAKGRALVLAMAALCLLPRLYTPWYVLAAGEALPEPRPLAEACVLFAMAALCRGRYFACAACLAIGGLLHPIMGAPGFCVLIIVLGLRDRRWLAALAVGAAGLLVAGSCGLPLAARLFVVIDPIWRGVLVERTPYLFVHLWPVESYGLQMTQAATILIAGAFVEARIRRLFHVVILVGLLGVFAALVLGDGLGVLLVVQAQLWRSFWLMAVLAPIAAGLCLAHLSARSAAGQVTLAALCIAWVTGGPMAPLAAVAALGLHMAAGRRAIEMARVTVAAAWGLALFFGGLSLWTSAHVFSAMLARRPDGLPGAWAIAWQLSLPAIPILAALYHWDRPAVRNAAGAAAAVGVAVLVGAWDIRSPARRDLDEATFKPDLAALLDTRPGPVLWLGGDEIWFWARRGNWAALTQGGSIVFSRDLAMQWRLRAQALVEHGLATGFLLDPWAAPAILHPLILDPAAVADFCQRPDAPSWIVAPLEPETDPPLGARIWTSHLAGWSLTVGEGDVRWMHRDRFALVPCGPARPA